MRLTVILPLSAGCGFGLSLVLTPVAAALACRVGLLDRPDGQRKMHTRPVPLAGGLAIFFAICITLAGACLSVPVVGQWFSESRLSVWGLAGSAAILCLVGVLDDRRPLRGSYKLLGQLLAVCVLLASGTTVQFVDLFGLTVQLGVLAAPVTVFWLLGAINSLNLIDGMDGMGSCVGGGIALAIAVLSLLTGQFAAALVALALVGAVAGFLTFNLPPARVFLGDCGSMIIGMVIGVLALQCALKGPTTVMLTIPVALFTLPILDTAAAITRRKLTGRSIYTPDRGHLHHRLQQSGLSRRRVLILVCFLCLLTGIGALATMILQRQLFAAISALSVIASLVVTRLFGHSELVLFRKRVSAWIISLLCRHDGHRTVEVCVHMQGNADWARFWKRVLHAACRFQVFSVRFETSIPLIQERYFADWDRLVPTQARTHDWGYEKSLFVRGDCVGRIEVGGISDDVPNPLKVAIFDGIAKEVEHAIASMLDQPEMIGEPAVELPFAGSVARPVHASEWIEDF